MFGVIDVARLYYNIRTIHHIAVKPQSYAPEDGQKIARNVLS